MYKTIRKNKPPRHSRKRFNADPLFEEVPKDINGRRKLNELCDEKLLEIAEQLIKREKIPTITELNHTDSSLLLELRKRKITSRLKLHKEEDQIPKIKGFPFVKKALVVKKVSQILETLPENPPKHPSGRTNWKAWTNDQKFAFAYRKCQKGEIKTVTQLLEYNKELYNILTRLELTEELPFEKPPKERNIWRNMGDDEVIILVNRVISLKNIETVEELAKQEPATYGICQKRGLIRKLDLQFQRAPRGANKKSAKETRT